MAFEQVVLCGCCDDSGSDVQALDGQHFTGYDHQDNLQAAPSPIAEVIVCEWAVDLATLAGDPILFPNLAASFELIAKVSSIDPVSSATWQLRLGGTVADPTSGQILVAAALLGEQIPPEFPVCIGPQVSPPDAGVPCRTLKLTVQGGTENPGAFLTISTRGVHVELKRSP